MIENKRYNKVWWYMYLLFFTTTICKLRDDFRGVVWKGSPKYFLLIDVYKQCNFYLNFFFILLLFRNLKPKIMLDFSLEGLSKGLVLFFYSEYTFFISLIFHFPILALWSSRTVNTGWVRATQVARRRWRWLFIVNRDLN